MKIAAFTYIRNGFNIDYPFLQAIKSILPIVDEFIVVVGNSTDDTRNAVLALNDEKIKIVDSVWDEAMRTGGFVYAQQANIGLDNVAKDADWLFHIQADEAVHEKDLPTITKAMQDNLNNKEVEGFLFNFINFFGDYNHYAPSRRYHQKEIRIVRNNPHVRSYKDSQGFRIFENPANAINEKGRKLHVKKINATIYHYSHARKPDAHFKKSVEFGKGWQPNDEWIKQWEETNKNTYDDFTGNIDYLKEFTGTHPAVMQERIAQQDWEYTYNPAINNMTVKEKFLHFLEMITGKQFFTYKNYKLIK